MNKILGGILLSLFFAVAASAQVQNPGVQQTGSVVANNCAAWNGTRVIKDAGAPCLTTSTSIQCSQLPAFTGDVTKAIGVCALVIPSDTITTLMLQNLAVTTGKIAAANVTYAKIQNVTASRLLGNPTGLAASPSEIDLGATLAFSGTQLRTTAITGDVTAPANSFATTLATVNANVGSFGSATQCPSFTVNAKGLITAAAQTACAVQSVFGRTGAVVAVQDDYLFSQVSKGVTTNTAASSGYVGELVDSGNNCGSPIAGFVSNTAKDASATITLTPGNWTLAGFGATKPAGTTTTSGVVISISPTANTNGNDQATLFGFTSSGGALVTMAAPEIPVSISSNTTYRIVMQITFATSTMSACARVWAKRTS